MAAEHTIFEVAAQYERYIELAQLAVIPTFAEQEVPEFYAPPPSPLTLTVNTQR